MIDCCDNFWKKRRHITGGPGTLNKSRGDGGRDSHVYSPRGFWRTKQHMS